MSTTKRTTTLSTRLVDALLILAVVVIGTASVRVVDLLVDSPQARPIQAAVTPRDDQRNPTVDIHILAGQSNMDGRANSDNAPLARALPPQDLTFHADAVIDSGTYILSAWDMRVLRPSAGIVNSPNHPNAFGPELSFADALPDHTPQQTPATITLIIKHARGGTSLNDDWSSVGQDRIALLNAVDRALTLFQDAGYTPTVKSFSWVQGETDALSEDAATSYAANLQDLIDAVRALTSDDIRIAIAELNPAAGPHAAKIIEQQRRTAGSDPRIALVNTDDLTRLDDLHYDARSTVILGRRLHAAVTKEP